MTHDHDDQQHDDHQHDEQDEEKESQGGQVSELAVAGEAPAPISAGDAVAGQPDGESGEVQEGATGPNAIPEDPTGEHPHTT